MEVVDSRDVEAGAIRREGIGGVEGLSVGEGGDGWWGGGAHVEVQGRS